MATRTAGRAGLLGLLALCMLAMACGGAREKPAGERVLPVHELDSMRLYMETGQWAAVQESGRKLMQAGAAAGQAHQEALRLMAQAYKKQGLADSALAMQEHAFRMAQQADDRPSQSSLWLNISTTGEERGMRCAHGSPCPWPKDSMFLRRRMWCGARATAITPPST